MLRVCMKLLDSKIGLLLLRQAKPDFLANTGSQVFLFLRH